jgi:dihydrofolate reductase
MPRLRVHCFGLSIDGFGAGPAQSLANPMGLGGMALHNWVFPTRTFRLMHPDLQLGPVDGPPEGTTGIDDQFVARGFHNLGAWIIGRNMFTHSRGPWPDDSWTGWWGPNPPFHTPVFVLTHHPRPPLVMEGGTTFHFVTRGIHEALQLATDAAGAKDIRLGGGTNTIRQYLSARLIDHLHLVISPTLLGSGEHLLQDLNFPALGYEITEHASSATCSHLTIERIATSQA